MNKFLLGVLGERISYTLSPQIFAWACRETGVNADYRIYDLSPPDARKLLLDDRAWNGLNVTTPHKSLAFDYCKRLSDEARATQAVNTVVRKNDVLCGYNTDVAGIRFALSMAAGADFRPRNALVIGSGGAARAVLYALSEDHSDTRKEVASRAPEQARASLAPILQRFRASSCIDVDTASHFLRDFDLVIQATPVGSDKIPGCPLQKPLKFKEGAIVMDLIYAPRRTKFLQYAEENGARTQNGLPMLIAQAAESFRIWTGIEFPLKKAMAELLPELTAA